MKRRWKGPYEVLERSSSVNYKVQRDGAVQSVHVQRMRAVADHDVTMAAYDYDLSVTSQELDAINKTIENLSARKALLQHEQQKVVAAQEVCVEVGINTLHVNRSSYTSTCLFVEADNASLL